MKRGTLLVRADATVASGTGHVMRCIALVQAWQSAGGDVLYAMAESTIAIEERLRAEPFTAAISVHADPGSAEDLRQTRDIAVLHKAEWAVVDGYHFDAHYVSELQELLSVMTIDDNGGLEFYSSELVLNQNVHASAEMYAKRGPRTRLLLGPRYALLRNEFAAYRDWAREISERGNRVLVTMGGSDPKDLTPRIVSALASLPIDDLQIRVVVGGSAENRHRVGETAKRFSDRVEVMPNVANMAELMAWADLAIAGAGTTCWEMCLLGLPAILIVVADNQEFIAERLASLGAAVNAGPAESIDFSLNRFSLLKMSAELLDDRDRRIKMSQSARELVDGRGRDRVLEMMQARDATCA